MSLRQEKCCPDRFVDLTAAAALALCAAVRQTLANGLALLGVQAPEKM